METFALCFLCRLKHSCTILYFCFSLALAAAQESIKYETETPVEVGEVHAAAREAVEKMKLGNVRWIREINFNSQSFEAKAIWGKMPVSIEFDTAGVFEDMEIDVRFNTLEKETRNIVKQHLKALFLKHRIKKVQRQFSGDVNKVIEMINHQNASPDMLERFEIEVYALLKKQWRYFELLFEKDGRLVLKREINMRELKHEAF